MFELIGSLNQDRQGHHDLILFLGGQEAGERIQPTQVSLGALLQDLMALLCQGDLLDAPVMWVFGARDQPLMHQALQHLAGGGIGDAQVVADLRDATNDKNKLA
jgi:hypothetical protein